MEYLVGQRLAPGLVVASEATVMGFASIAKHGEQLQDEVRALTLQNRELCAALERLIPIVRVLTKDSTEAADADNAEGLVMKCRRLAVYDMEKRDGGA
jgi:hypothetical protein